MHLTSFLGILYVVGCVSAAITPCPAPCTCTFVCPLEDEVKKHQTSAIIQLGNIICEYGGVGDCVYDATSGGLILDNNIGECVRNAVGSAGCPPSKRIRELKRAAYTRVRKNLPELPQYMKEAIEGKLEAASDDLI